MSVRQLEMRIGSEQKMFTLWMVHSGDRFYRESFRTNLAINKEEAWKKAETTATKLGLELFDSSPDIAKEIVRKGDGKVNFGKHYGKLISSLEDGYLCWLADGAKVKEEIKSMSGPSTGEYYMKELADEWIKEEALEVAVKRGLYSEYEGKLLSNRYIEFLKNEKSGYGHHAKEKDKVELELKILKSYGYHTDFGYTFVVTYLDEATGLKYQYKGSNPPYIEDKEHSTMVTATVKLGNSKGIDITYLQRIKVLENRTRVVYDDDKNVPLFKFAPCRTEEVIKSCKERYEIVTLVEGGDISCKNIKLVIA